MSSHAWAGFIQHEPSKSPNLVTPAPGAPIIRPQADLGPTDVELDNLQWGERLNGPLGHPQGQETSTDTRSTNVTPGQLEQSNPATPRASQVDPAMSVKSPPMNKWRLAAICLMVFNQGINDAAPGALIPYMEEEYNIGYAIVSLIFVTNALGFIVAAPLVQAIEQRFGRGRTYAFSGSLVAVGYIAILCDPPYPLIVVSFFLLGFGMAINLALNNVFCANLANGTVILGFMHGSYGVGGTISPLMATAMASNGIRWSLFYLISLSMTLISLFSAGWAFWNYERDVAGRNLTALDRTASRRSTEAGEPTKARLLKQAVRNRTTLLGALFIFAYQGAEVSISGWMISFLINYRDGDPAQVGYVTAGFWAGITLGRFLLVQPATKVGERISVYVLIVGTAAFQLLSWLVPNVIGNAIAVSLVGLLLGPVYPCATIIFSRLLPPNIQLSSLSFISSMGSSGGALAPFTTGIMAQRVGTMVLHPICIGLYMVMGLFWTLLPKVVKRSE